MNELDNSWHPEKMLEVQLKEIECVKEYYGYSNDKAKSALDILTKDEIKLIKEKLYKGGTK